MAHLYASFADATLAEKAAGALLDYGVRQEDISLVAHDDYGKTRASNDRGSAVGATQAAGSRLAQAGDRVAGAVTGRLAQKELPQITKLLVMPVLPTAAFGDMGIYDNPGSRSDIDPMDGDDSTVNSHSDTENAAKHGISTTTAADAGAGAIKGTGVGLGVGILASVAALAVPGIGTVLGAGLLASALGATAATAAAGAVAGGVTGYLKDQGVPGDVAHHYQSAVEQGGGFLSVNVPSGKVDQAQAQEILAKYGASNVNSY